MCCLQDRNEEQQAADPAFKFSVQCLNTFFWPKLVQGGHAGEAMRLLALLHSTRGRYLPQLWWVCGQLHLATSVLHLHCYMSCLAHVQGYWTAQRT